MLSININIWVIIFIHMASYHFQENDVCHLQCNDEHGKTSLSSTIQSCSITVQDYQASKGQISTDMDNLRQIKNTRRQNFRRGSGGREDLQRGIWKFGRCLVAHHRGKLCEANLMI